MELNEDYSNSDNEEIAPSITTSKIHKDSDKKTKQDNKKLLESNFPGKPKRYMSSYLLYYKDTYKNSLKDNAAPLNEVAKDSGVTWNNLPYEQKLPFIKKSESLKEDYFRDMRRWVDTWKDHPNFPLQKFMKFLEGNVNKTIIVKNNYVHKPEERTPNVQSIHVGYTNSLQNVSLKKHQEDYHNVKNVKKTIMIQTWNSRSCSHESKEDCIYCKLK